MDEQEVFAFLKKQKKAVLLGYLHAAFQEMTARQHRAVLADAVRQPMTATVADNQTSTKCFSERQFAVE